jgi:hypothetical protein
MPTRQRRRAANIVFVVETEVIIKTNYVVDFEKKSAFIYVSERIILSTLLSMTLT